MTGEEGKTDHVCSNRQWNVKINWKNEKEERRKVEKEEEKRREEKSR